MIWVALAALAALAATVVAFAGVLRGLVRQQARERERLVDQVLHLAGRTWSPPPVDTAAREPLQADELRRIEERMAYAASPEQLPEF